MRLFIAVNLSETQKQQIHVLQQRLAGYLDGVKWADHRGLHLTLKFLGEVGQERLPGIIAAMAASVESRSPFRFQLGRTGVFPAPHKARILWIGLLEGAAPVKDVAAALAHNLKEQGFGVEKRVFLPHLTVGRLRYPLPEDRIAQFLKNEKTFSTAAVNAAGITLFRSDLSLRGAAYTKVGEILFS